MHVKGLAAPEITVKLHLQKSKWFRVNYWLQKKILP